MSLCWLHQSAGNRRYVDWSNSEYISVMKPTAFLGISWEVKYDSKETDLKNWKGRVIIKERGEAARETDLEKECGGGKALVCFWNRFIKYLNVNVK